MDGRRQIEQFAQSLGHRLVILESLITMRAQNPVRIRKMHRKSRDFAAFARHPRFLPAAPSKSKNRNPVRFNGALRGIFCQKRKSRKTTRRLRRGWHLRPAQADRSRRGARHRQRRRHRFGAAPRRYGRQGRLHAGPAQPAQHVRRPRAACRPGARARFQRGGLSQGDPNLRARRPPDRRNRRGILPHAPAGQGARFPLERTPGDAQYAGHLLPFR